MKATTTFSSDRMLVSLAFLSSAIHSPRFFELIGAAFGILGTTVLAFMPERLFTVFVCYAFSNAALIVFSTKGNHQGIFAMTAVYSVLTVKGLITNWPI